MDKRIFKSFIFLGLLLSLCLIACTQKPAQKTTFCNNFQKKVLCSIGMISELTKAVAGKTLLVQTLIKEDLDPHAYELVKGDDEKLLGADLIFYNGLNLEHSPSISKHLKSHSNSFALGDYINTNFPDLILTAQGEVDPHIWMDISIWEKCVPLIVEKLSLIEPQHQTLYRENGKKLQEKLLQTHEKVLALMKQIPESKRYLITCHDAFYYFARRYLSDQNEFENGLWKKRFTAPEGLAPDSELSTQDIKRVIEHMRAHHIETVFPEYHVNLDSILKIQEVSSKSGHLIKIAKTPLYGDTMTPLKNAPDSYTMMILHNAETIYHHLMEAQL